MSGAATDLDKLAKWADEWPAWQWTDAQNDALKSLIASARRDAEEIERLRGALERISAQSGPVSGVLCRSIAYDALTARAAHAGEG